MGGQLVDPFCAKVLCSRQPTTDTALSSRTLHISMIPWSKNLRQLDDAAIERIANDFQPRLLLLRLSRSEKVRRFEFDLSFLAPRIQDLAHALLLPFRDRETRKTLLRALAEHASHALLERANEPEGMVLRAVFNLSHKSDDGAALVGEIAFRINASRKEVGEEYDLKPRAVGAILKSLGLPTNKLASYGRGLRFTEPVKRRIHQLLKNYGLQPLPSEEIAACPLCVEMWSKVDPKSRQ